MLWSLPRRRLFATLAALASLSLVGAPAVAQVPAGPDELIRQVSTEVIDAVKADKAIQAGDVLSLIHI